MHMHMVSLGFGSGTGEEMLFFWGGGIVLHFRQSIATAASAAAAVGGWLLHCERTTACGVFSQPLTDRWSDGWIRRWRHGHAEASLRHIISCVFPAQWWWIVRPVWELAKFYVWTSDPDLIPTLSSSFLGLLLALISWRHDTPLLLGLVSVLQKWSWLHHCTSPQWPNPRLDT